MGRPVVHFEVIGKDPGHLRRYFSALFGWDFTTPSPVAAEVSAPDDHGFVDAGAGGPGIPGGIGGGPDHDSHVVFYVGVPDVEAALQQAEDLGGRRRRGPVRSPTGLVVGHFTDPEGHLVGLAGLTATPGQ